MLTGYKKTSPLSDLNSHQMLMISILTKDIELDKKSSWLSEEGKTRKGVKPRTSSEHSRAGKHKRINGQQPAGGKAFRYSGFFP